MRMIPVSSSNIFAIGWENGTLRVEFKDKNDGIGSVYDYEGVPQTVFTEMQNAPSQGKYLAANIKGIYPHHKVG